MRLTRSSIPDFKVEGLWVKTFTTFENGIAVQNSTRSYTLWRSVIRRCSPEASNYQGSISAFKDYQTFTSWCNIQDGYMNKETDGRYWALDKDWLSPENPIYSENTCLFVPVRVNALTVNHKKRAERGLPLGVSFYRKYHKYSAVCGRGKTLGYFDCPKTAHIAWQAEQINRLKRAVEEDFSDKLKKAILDRASKIEEDMLLGRETKYGE